MIKRPVLRVFSFVIACVIAWSCGPGAPLGEIKGISEGMRFNITADSLPPHAMDRITWRVTVRDARTGQPVEGGQGRIWGRSKDFHPTSDGFLALPELGVYSATMPFITAGAWQMGMQFRRDSTKPFAQINWTQEVKAPRPLGG